ncbi:hypothetical protein Pyn_23970 [Prunus yedoensis var. nudiflora]|uniref:B box-type domain-containing protein n=1 Tax=Prunus yedoensis var. nudiflora TaxID=2094558 RepID=A0A314USQ9_PRUYE|nr:hypothetical protein Pyn_23970 [Prunus yedoensis var. nudiflora]
MCRGVEESGFCQPPVSSPTGYACCELCSKRASLYCLADDAYLCRKCDQWVHGANFLALRHVRCLLCNTCQNLTQRYVVGISVEMLGLDSKQGSGHQNKKKKDKKHGDSQSASKFWPEKIANHRVQN